MTQKEIETQLNTMSDEEIWRTFSSSRKELKKRGLVRTGNIVGERGEFLTIETYKNNSSLPNLQAAPEGTQNVDALSRKGERYSIKTITEPSRTTGVFYNCGNLNDELPSNKKFEYVVIVIINSDFDLEKMLELDWDLFLKLRKWHKTMNAWNLTITKKLIEASKIIFEK